MPSNRDLYPTQGRRYPSETSDPGSDSEPAPAGKPELPPELETTIARLGPSRVTVLLVGGSRAARRAVALALHERSPRVGRPFVAFDCAGLDAARLELELFGGLLHEVHASGAIQLAEAGTIYVAAIDELPLLVQPRFLRFLDDERTVRVVASTKQDLMRRVTLGDFRSDLAERLALVEIALPGEDD